MPNLSQDPRRSATVVVVRDTSAGLQVLLLKRADKADANGAAWVFPGGLVDAGDADTAAHCALREGVSNDDPMVALAVTAIRECFEECGLLFARSADGRDLVDEDVRPWYPWREPLNRGERSMKALLEASAFTLALRSMKPMSRWITPPGMRKRFDTQFFLARAPDAQHAVVDGAETVDHRWLTPGEALADDLALKLLTPTRSTLSVLAGCADVDAALARARATAEAGPVMPRLGRDGDALRPVTPDEPAYVELGRLDPLGKGNVACTITPGVAVRLSARVIRVTAPNAGVMTGPGTNSYLVGPARGDGDWAVIDPGPDDESHLQALMAAVPGRIRWIFVTHTHLDHSPLARRLAAVTGATVLGRKAAHAQAQDPSFEPDVELQGGESFTLHAGESGGEGDIGGPAHARPCTTLHVVHTPGHASNHLCFRLEEESTLFTGDHVMQRSTVVINPPDGDMAAYLHSLRALARDHGDLQWLAPGHGFLIDQPVAMFEAIVVHRLRREAKVLAAMGASQAQGVGELVGRVYDDVPAALHGLAQRSLGAHLIKLEGEGRARRDAAGRWLLTVA